MMNMCNKDCFYCVYPDCIRDERQDTRDREQIYYQHNKKTIRERQNNRYHSNIEASRKYHRDNAKKNYDTQKNTENCKKYRNTEKKREYDRVRYLSKKVN